MNPRQSDRHIAVISHNDLTSMSRNDLKIRPCLCPIKSSEFPVISHPKSSGHHDLRWYKKRSVYQQVVNHHLMGFHGMLYKFTGKLMAFLINFRMDP